MFGMFRRFVSRRPSSRRSPTCRVRVEQLEDRQLLSTTVLADPSGALHAFVIRADHQVYEANLTAAGAPSSAYTLVATGKVQWFDAAHDSNGNIHLFALGMDNRVYQVLFNSHGVATTSYQGTAPAEVKSFVVGQDTKGNPEVFAVSRASSVYALDFNADGTMVQGKYTLVADGKVRSIIVTHNGAPGSGGPVIFAVESDGQVYSSVATGQLTFSTFQLVGTGTMQSIAAGQDKNDNTIHLFSIGMDNRVYQISFNADATPKSGWAATKPRKVQQIAVGNDSAGNVQLFAIGMDSRVYSLNFAGSTPAAHYFWVAPARAKALSLTVVNVQNGNSEVFVTRKDGRVWAATATAPNKFNHFVLVAAGRAEESNFTS
jgi:hypothetical protein